MRIQDARILNGGDGCPAEVVVTVRATQHELHQLPFELNAHEQSQPGIYDIHLVGSRAAIRAYVEDIVKNSRDCVWLILLGKKIFERLDATYREKKPEAAS